MENAAKWSILSAQIFPCAFGLIFSGLYTLVLCSAACTFERFSNGNREVVQLLQLTITFPISSWSPKANIFDESVLRCTVTKDQQRRSKVVFTIIKNRFIARLSDKLRLRTLSRKYTVNFDLLKPTIMLPSSLFRTILRLGQVKCDTALVFSSLKYNGDNTVDLFRLKCALCARHHTCHHT